LKGELFIRQLIEPGQAQLHDADGNDAGNKGQQYRLPDKLTYQRTPLRSYHLPYAYLLGPLLTAGSTEVHKIDTGYEQDEGSDDPKQTHIFYLSAFFHPTFEAGIKP